jgi:histidine triad (HIT) family protein
MIRMKRTTEGECRFCDIISSKESDYKVFEDDISMAFLDKRPLFIGHTLLVPKKHTETLYDVPNRVIGRLFSDVKFVAKGVELAMHADGTFIAINNKVSQSVPHLHIHIVPRRFKDGLHGFFWPRMQYKSPEEEADVRHRIMATIAELSEEKG